MNTRIVSHIICPADCRLVRFIMFLPRWFTKGVTIEAARVGQDTRSWVKIFWSDADVTGVDGPTYL